MTSLLPPLPTIVFCLSRIGMLFLAWYISGGLNVWCDRRALEVVTVLCYAASNVTESFY